MSIGIDTKLIFSDTFDCYDLAIDSNGQLTGENSFDNAILMSLFCDKRADSTEVVPPQLRRGWWANSFLFDNNYEIGSKLWLLEQRRRRQETLNIAEDYTRKCLLWMIEDSLCLSIEVQASFLNNTLIINILFKRPDNTVFNKTIDVWNNTLVTERTRFGD